MNRLFRTRAAFAVLALGLASCDAHRATESVVRVKTRALIDSTGLARGARAPVTALSDPAACTVDGGSEDGPGSYPQSRKGDGSACSTTVTSDPATPYPLLQSAFGGREQMENLEVTFSQGVGTIHVSGMGAIKCSGATYGTAIAFSATSVELGRADFTLIDPADCSPLSNPDDVTFGAEVTLAIPAGVRRIVILPPQPWSFDVLGNEGFATAFYTISFIEADGPRAHVKITADSAILAQGDTTVFRVTAPGATQWTVTGYYFVPVAGGVSRALRGPTALRAPASADTRTPATERAQPLPVPRNAHFLDAAFECSEATVELCYDHPLQTGYEVVTAVVDGEMQRDSVLVTVVPVLEVSCTPAVVVRADYVTCTAAMSDLSDFVPTHRKSTTTEGTLVDEDLVDSGAITSYEWGGGRALVSTHVEISGKVGQSPAVSGQGSFTVNPRSGPEWTGLRLPLPAPTPEYVEDPFLPPNPFLNDSSLMAPEGNLGRYSEMLGHNAAAVTVGPNANLLYFYSPSVVTSLSVYVHAWLLPSSDFYKKQRGNSNVVLGTRPCVGQDIDRLRRNVEAHELKHFTEDKAYFDSVDVQKRIETAHVKFLEWQLAGTPEYDAAKKRAIDQAIAAAYGNQWDAIVNAAVNRNYPVATPNCRRQ